MREEGGDVREQGDGREG
jgi:hypothetical protein